MILRPIYTANPKIITNIDNLILLYDSIVLVHDFKKGVVECVDIINNQSNITELNIHISPGCHLSDLGFNTLIVRKPNLQRIYYKYNQNGNFNVQHNIYSKKYPRNRSVLFFKSDIHLYGLAETGITSSINSIGSSIFYKYKYKELVITDIEGNILKSTEELIRFLEGYIQIIISGEIIKFALPTITVDIIIDRQGGKYLIIRTDKKTINYFNNGKLKYSNNINEIDPVSSKIVKKVLYNKINQYVIDNYKYFIDEPQKNKLLKDLGTYLSCKYNIWNSEESYLLNTNQSYEFSTYKLIKTDILGADYFLLPPDDRVYTFRNNYIYTSDGKSIKIYKYE